MTPPDRERRAREEALLPCPFCGEAPTMSRSQDESLWSHNIVWWSRVACSGCDIAMSECEDDDGTKVTAAWNYRTNPDAEAVRQAERERMARVVEGMLDEVPTCCGNCAYDTLFDEQRETFKRVLTALAAPPETPNV